MTTTPPDTQPEISPADIAEAMGQPSPNLDFLMDIPLQVTVELGRTRIPIKSIMQLKKNAIIPLDRAANEPVDILVNDKPFAKGEVVIDGERIAIQVTDIVSPRERIQKLG